MTDHSPNRPDWSCTGCLEDWPCVTRRRQLLAQYHGTLISLSVYMTSQLLRACVDLPGEPAGRLYNRLVGWIATAGCLTGK